MLSSNVAFDSQQTLKMSIGQQQPVEAAGANKQQQQQKPVKPTKIRRSRQPRNPQLSVARRNERERNRVKMVNNGFALLREHLPVEDLKACEQSGSDTPTPGEPKSKAGAKKFSKVETLRAAIQRIRMLEELIRSTEPEFESINIGPSAAGTALAAAYELGEEPISEPLSCGSASSQSQQSLHHHHHHHQQHQHLSHQHSQIIYQQPGEQFVKLEPQQQVSPLASSSLPSPQNSQHSHTSGHHQYNQHQAAQEPQSHTHLWIQQHQNSFLEQQQQHYQQQWYPQQQQQQMQDQKSWFVPSESPDSNNHQMGNQQQNQQQQLEPVWFQSSPGAPLPHQAASSSQPTAAAFATGHSIGQHHQISLYSQ